MATKRKILSIRMYKEKWRQWRKAAQQRGLTLTDLVEMAMDKELNGDTSMNASPEVAQEHLPRPV